MKRTAELAPLSRDHHVALEHALRLRRTLEEDVAEVVAGFLAFLVTDGRAHFAQEEELLAPQVPDDHADLAGRMVAEHDEVLRRAEALGRCPDVASARGLGELLSRHVRFEERELFPLLERQLPAPRMHELGRELTRVRAGGSRSTRPLPSGSGSDAVRC
jgi:hemerythrin-like domain-containing protein